MFPDADPLLDAGKVAIFGCLGYTRPNGIQIDVNHTGGNGSEIKQCQAFEAGFPEPSFHFILFIGSSGDEFVEKSHKPAEAAEPFSDLGNTLGAKCQVADLLFNGFRRFLF